MDNCNPRCIPILPGLKTQSNDSEKFEDQKIYKQIVGSLIYLSTVSRPDISFSVSLVSRYLDKPTQQHFQIVKGILRYLKGTMNYGITFTKHSEIHGYISIFHFVRDHLNKGSFKLIYCESKNMIADLLTKAVSKPTLLKHLSQMNIMA